jgi:MOSC domain-containing protein
VVVEGIWRYPVKSLGGERLDRVGVDPRGLAGDRRFAIRDADGKFGSGKNTRRFRRMDGLLPLTARYVDGVPLIHENGRPVADIREYLGRDEVELAEEGEISHLDELPVSVLTTATLDWVREAVPEVRIDVRRFRPNVLVRTPPGTPPFTEDAWFGRAGRIGDVGVEFVRASERCVMVNEAQPGLEHSADILRAIATHHDNKLGALAVVTRPGTIEVGDPVALP